MSEEEILREFKDQLLNFFDELIQQFPEEGDLVVLRIFLGSQIPIKQVMEAFTLKINSNNMEVRNIIKERNEVFFLEHNIFGDVSNDKVNHFRKLWRSGNLDDCDKNTIWQWVDSFVYLSDKYVKIKH